MVPWLLRWTQSAAWWLQSNLAACSDLAGWLLHPTLPAGPDGDELSSRQVAEIRRSLERIRRDLDLLQQEHLLANMGALLRTTFGPPAQAQPLLTA